MVGILSPALIIINTILEKEKRPETSTLSSVIHLSTALFIHSFTTFFFFSAKNVICLLIKATSCMHVCSVTFDSL